jgi:hypothetical protein
VFNFDQNSWLNLSLRGLPARIINSTQAVGILLSGINEKQFAKVARYLLFDASSLMAS